MITTTLDRMSAGLRARTFINTPAIIPCSNAIFSTLVLATFTFPSWAHHNPNHGGGPGGGGGGGECSYPAFADKPNEKLRGNAADFTFQYGQEVEEVKSDPLLDYFEEDGSYNGGWFVETMVDEQHRVGNQGIDADGNALSGTPVGKRWSAWYNGTFPELLESDGAVLKLGGKETTEVDPTRPGTNWNAGKLYTTWLSTFQRELNDFGSAQAGSFSFAPPMYLETQVSFEQMKTPGFRLSMWMMPVEKPSDGNPSPSIAYDDNYDNGFEIDIFEFEPVFVTNNGTVCGNLIEFSWIRGFHSGKGKPPSGLDGKNHFEGLEEGYCSDQECSLSYADPNGQQSDINEGSHTIGLLWTQDLIAWSFNNELVLEITNSSMIPTREHYLIVSREMTNGLTQGQFQTDSVTGEWDIFLPAEPGLYGWNGNSNIGEYLENVNADKALIDSIKVWGTRIDYPLNQ